MVENIVNRIVSEKFEEQSRKKIPITGETKFDDIGFSSLDIMECIIETEGKIKKRVDNKKIRNIFTVGDLYKLFDGK